MQEVIKLSGKIFDLIKKKKPLTMGILNVTPDSFSDGGKYFQIEDAINHAKKLINQGVDIIDVGGESTRPDAELVSEEEELRRVIPVIKKLSSLISHFSPHVLISIDTYKSNVAKRALEAGVNIINDVSGLTMDLEMVNVARDANCGIVIMHNKEIPATKPREKSFPPLTFHLLPQCLNDVYTWLKKQTNFALENSVSPQNIIIDPGIGFGKTPEEDLYLIEHLYEFKSLGFPILVGSSRKSFIRKLFGEENFEVKNKEMIELAIKNGASIIRLH